MLKPIVIFVALVISTSAIAQNVQGAGSSGASPQVSGPMEKKMSVKKKKTTAKQKPAAGQGMSTGSSGSKAGTNSAK